MSQLKAVIISCLMLVLVLCLIYGFMQGITISFILSGFILLCVPAFLVLVNFQHPYFGNTQLDETSAANKRKFLDNTPSLLRIIISAHIPLLYLLGKEAWQCYSGEICLIKTVGLSLLYIPLIITNSFAFTFWLCTRKRRPKLNKTS